ncbi:GNAT family N-acetyltransferase [Alginatibacterium sediminis]|uniref:GNAT family N-acetyltransferase n=1 Tax=Alginatibacterium sediminis TaxID=2164068 RepID=A0A420ENR7_9ALTE|nr:GNAT family N-acetyltransferase [Alginatibacterium sediminis]
MVNPNEKNWQLFKFEELNTTQLYQILALRAEIFVVEQDCPYQDCDNKDQQAMHLCLFEKTRLLAYARLFAPDGPNQPAHIGRVVVAYQERSSKLGIALMHQAVNEVERLWHKPSIHISAQFHLQPFYTKFGFKSVGESYLEDDIPHIQMQR